MRIIRLFFFLFHFQMEQKLNDLQAITKLVVKSQQMRAYFKEEYKLFLKIYYCLQ